MDQVIFRLYGNDYVYEIDPQPFVNPDDIIRIHVPKQITSHSGWNCYWFDNLQQIIAHPDSSRYVTYDGCLYSKTGTLYYVPRGKTTLRLAPFCTQFDYRVFRFHEKLKEITVDPANESFHMLSGCLYSKDNRSVYFVADPRKRLYLSAEAKNISEDVLSQDLSSVFIEDGNPYFHTEGGMLINQDRIEYIFNRDSVIIPHAVTKITRETAEKLFGKNGSRTVNAYDHPVFKVRDGALFDQTRKELIFISPATVSLTVPDGFTLGTGSLYSAEHLEEISVPYGISVTKKAYGKFNGYTFEAFNHKALRRQMKAITVRKADGKICTFPGELRGSMQIIEKGKAEVKPGTEILFLELSLAGFIEDPVQIQNFMRSAFQIMTYLVDQDDLTRLQRVIGGGRLITAKNISRLKKHAEENEKAEALALLNSITV